MTSETSSRLRPWADAMPRAVAAAIRCVYSTPLAGPVLPVVNPIISRSSPLAGRLSAALAVAASSAEESEWRSPSRVWPPQNHRRPTVTRTRALAKVRRLSTRTACAAGGPMNASAPTVR